MLKEWENRVNMENFRGRDLCMRTSGKESHEKTVTPPCKAYQEGTRTIKMPPYTNSVSFCIIRLIAILKTPFIQVFPVVTK